MPTAKLAAYAQLAEETAGRITHSHQEWTGFLQTAARLYKYPYHEQLMIYAQRPEATACAEYEIWNKAMRRYVRRGSRGIALIDTASDMPKLRYVFDIADTGGRENSRRPFLWELTEQNTPAAMNALENGYDVPASEGLERQLHAIASELSQVYWIDHQGEILDIVDGSYLEGYDEFNVGASFRKAVSVSLEYALLSRCGLSPNERFIHEDFLPIFDWNTPEATATLGTAVSEMSEEVLRAIEISVRNYERSMENERAELQAERGLPDSLPDHGANGASHRQVRQDAPDVPEGTPSNIVQFTGRDRQAVSAPAGDRGRGEQPVGADDARHGESGGRDRSAESRRPDEVGRPDEQSESAGRGNHSDGVDSRLAPETVEADRGERHDAAASRQPSKPEQASELTQTASTSSQQQATQLSFFPTEATQIAQIDRAESITPSALLFAAQKFSVEEFEHVLQSGSNQDGSRMRIATEFSKDKSKAELAAFLQSEYSGGKGFLTPKGRVAAWFDADGIRLARSDAARFNPSAQVIPWVEAVRRIDALLDRGEYATMDELYMAGQQERRVLAQDLLYLRRDFSEEGRKPGFLQTLDAYNEIGFPEGVEKLGGALEQAEFRHTLKKEMEALAQGYSQNPNLLSYRNHQPVRLLERLGELDWPRKEYESTLLESSALQGFITRDETDAELARGSGIENGRSRIASFFSQAHTDKEKADFLKNEYGIGGHSHALSGVSGSHEEHDAKGIRLQKPGCADVLLKWPEVARRIDALIAQRRYLPEKEKAVPSRAAITKEDIRFAIQEWNGDMDSKRAVVRRLREGVAYDDAPAVLREEYGDDMPAFPVNTAHGSIDLPWDEVREPLLDLIAAEQFFTEDEQDALENIDPIAIRERLAERGIVDGKVVDPAKLAQDPFIQQVEADVERFAADTSMEANERFHVVELDRGPKIAYGIWDDLHNGYYVDGEGVTEAFDSEWQAQSYLEELRRTVDEKVKEAAAQTPPVGMATEEAGSSERTLSPEARPSPKPAPSPKQAQPPYRVGDTVYLDNTPFEITEIRESSVQLLDHALAYPIFRAESKENFENLLRLDPRNQAIIDALSTPDGGALYVDRSVAVAESHDAQGVMEQSHQEAGSPAPASGKEAPTPDETATPTPPRTWEEAVAVYPAEPNHLPFDVVVNQIHVGEPEHTAPSQPAPQNFRIMDDDLGAGGAKTKYACNVAAIRTLQAIEAENRYATPDEQQTLSRYVGWGGIPQVFDEQNAGWSKEYAELKDLLTEDEYASARASTLNAHYTSPTVIRAIYDTVERMGFRTGNILEPACGVGNFFGLLPESMAGSHLYGTELDSITGRIAQRLYPHADIAVVGFETTDRRDFYDLAVGNVPFGNYKVQDRPYDKLNFNIHDYFFAKAIDQVRPGGVIAFITSKGTMDKQSPDVRKYLAQRAELLGAVRLPNNAFKANAGTEVTSDILFLQKREHPIDIELDWVHLGMTEDGIPINNYFAEHPEMVLGKMAWDDSMYGNRKETACLPVEGAELGGQLANAMQNIYGQLTPVDLSDLGEGETVDTSIPADPDVKNYSYTVVDGEVYYRENSVMVKPNLNATATERVKGMVRLRDCVRELIDQQMDGAPDEIIQRTQARLSALYDAYTAKHGLLNSRGNANAFSSDSSYYLLCSLEIIDENGQLERKADMFTRRTIRPAQAVEHVDTASEALALSIAEKACVDMAYMAEVSGKTEETLASELRGVIFRLPESAGNEPRYAPADEYLSGNVRSKLSLARQAAERDEAFTPNVAALEQAMPKELDASEIEVRLGATWIEPRYIQQFMTEFLEPPMQARYRLRVNFSTASAEWNIANKGTVPYNNVAAHATYGTSRVSAYEILEDSLNLRDARIYDTVRDPDGNERRVLNPKETTLAQQKQQLIKDGFRDWIWRDATRRQELVARYNELFNSNRPREYNGQHITFSGMNPEITLRPHQRDAIAHILYGGNTLLAHEVGAGKTFEMVAACMESKRLGLCQKAMFVVPNHLTEQWASEFLRLYPSANILVATRKDFETRNRKKFCARIATGEYDAVIIGHSQFERIPISVERQERLLQEQIAEIQEGIEELKLAHAERFTIKQLERSRKQLTSKLKKLTDAARKDDVITFEELGVDRLYVDEAHNYKNLFLYTKMRNVAGLSTTDAQKSSDMYLKCRYLDELTGGRGTVFATGTPVSNSMTELYVRP